MSNSLRPLEIAAALALSLLGAGCTRQEEGPLLCYVGGTMRPAIEELAALYEKETGQKVEIDYADSGALLVKIENSRQGDLYVCHDPFAGAFQKKDLGIKVWTVAVVTPTIAVQKGNPKQIAGLADLARDGIRIGLTDADYSTLGHINPVMFKKTGLEEKIERNVATRSRMGGQVANAVSIGELDAAVVWNAVIFARRSKLDPVEIEAKHRPHPEVDAVTSPTFGRIDRSSIKVTIATLKCSKQAKAATEFAQFVASRRGRAVFAAHGFSPAPESALEPEPTPPGKPAVTSAAPPLYLYAAASMRPAMAECTEAFTASTGVRVICDYAGSGVLLSRIRASKQGDLYMPGSIEYIARARELDLIRSHKEICYFVPIILVRKGNPKGIKTLDDLARPGIKLGLGDPDACAIGKISQAMFKKNSLPLDKLAANLVFSSLTVNELGIQIKTGQLDAAIVWDAIAAYYPDDADAVPIPLKQNVVSTVAIGVLSSAGRFALADRFVSFLASDAGRAIFARHDYTIRLPAE